jgi:hypothetical protein
MSYTLKDVYVYVYRAVHRPTDVVLSLKDTGKSEYLGEIQLTCTLWPKTQEDKEQVTHH